MIKRLLALALLLLALAPDNDGRQPRHGIRPGRIPHRRRTDYARHSDARATPSSKTSTPTPSPNGTASAPASISASISRRLTNAQEVLNLTIASGDLPDVIVGFNVDPSTLALFGPQGLFLPLSGLIEEQGHFIHDVFAGSPQVRPLITSPDGEIYGLAPGERMLPLLLLAARPGSTPTGWRMSAWTCRKPPKSSLTCSWLSKSKMPMAMATRTTRSPWPPPPPAGTAISTASC